MNYILPVLVVFSLFIVLGILIKPIFGIYLIIISIILESFYIIILDANLKIPYILVLIVLIGMLFQLLLKAKLTLKFNYYQKIILVFLLISFISILYSPKKLDSFKSVLLYFFFVSILITISFYINSLDRLKKAINILMIVIIFASLFGFLQLISEVIFKSQMLYPNSTGYMTLARIPQKFRPPSLFVEADQFGKFNMVFLLFFLPFLNKKEFSKQISFTLLRITFYFSLLSLIIAQTRSAWLGFSAGLLHYILINIKNKKINFKIIIKIIMPVIIFLLVLFLLSPTVFEQLIERSAGILNVEVGSNSGITRIIATKSMLDLVISSPKNIFFGLGTGSLNYYGPKYAQIGIWPQFMGKLGGGAFSLYVNILFNIGLLGLFVFLIFIFKFYQINLKVKKNLEIQNSNSIFSCIITGSILSFTGILVSSIVADSVNVTYFWVLLGLNSAAINIIEMENEHESINTKQNKFI